MHIFTNPGTTMTQLYHFEPALETLHAGGLVLYPTDTVWAIGCDATNSEALDRLQALRQTDEQQPPPLLAASVDMLKKYVAFIHPRVETLLLYHQRPLTVVYDTAANLPPQASAPNGNVAFRVPTDDFCRQLVERFGKPLAAAGAHISSSPYPNHFGEISSAIIIGVDYVIKHRQLDKNMSETAVVARLGENGELDFLRA